MAAICFGNRCGHDPENPVLDTGVKLHPKAPMILSDIIKKVRVFYAHPDTLPFFNHDERQRRTESREAIVQVLTILIKHLDLPTMKVIRKEHGQNRNVELRYLHSQTNLSFSRFKRAWLSLIDAGVIKSFKQHEKQESGDYKGLPSIKLLSPLLFGAAGLSRRLKAARDYLSQKMSEAKAAGNSATQKLIKQADSARAKKAMKKATKGMKGLFSRSYSPPPRQQERQDVHALEREKQRQLAALGIN